MVCLGGLEFVAAGYLLNEMHKSGKDADEKKRRRRRDSDSRPSSHQGAPPKPDRPGRPHALSQSQSLYPPSAGNHRPTSAPPPQSRPTWPIYTPASQQQQQYHQQPPQQQQQQQHQQQYYQPQWQQPNQQQWRPPQPQQPQIQLHPPPQPQPQHAQTFPMSGPPPSYHSTPNVPRPHKAPHLPPDGWYYNMRTGKLQQTLYPQDEGGTRSISVEALSHEPDQDASSGLAPGGSRQRSRSYSRQRPRRD